MGPPVFIQSAGERRSARRPVRRGSARGAPGGPVGLVGVGDAVGERAFEDALLDEGAEVA